MADNNPIDISGLTLESKLVKRGLYGGAMTISIPAEWRDVSDVRQVPDHQEVYQDCTFANNSEGGNKSSNNNASTTNHSLQGTGGCLVVEILERQDDVSDDDATSFFFNDLANANESETADSSNRSLAYTNIWTVGKAEVASSSSDEKYDNEENLIPNLSARVKACSCIGNQTIGTLRNKDELEEGKASEVIVEMCVIRLEAVQTDLLISLSMPIFSKKVGKKDEGSRKEHSALYLSILKSFEVLDWSLFC